MPREDGAAAGATDGFGPVSVEPLSRVQKLGARKMVQAWTTVPQVTHFDEADITGLLGSDKAGSSAAAPSLNAWLARACVVSLQQHPRLCASLHEDAGHLVVKHYVNLGIAVSSPYGLVVATLYNAHKQSLSDLDHSIRELAGRAREGKLLPRDLEGSCFTISNLGRHGGTGFTPIVNVPEVAILGISRTLSLPRFVDEQFVERSILPLSLSYDHRVVNGMDAAAFCGTLRGLLESPDRLT